MSIYLYIKQRQTDRREISQHQGQASPASSLSCWRRAALAVSMHLHRWSQLGEEEAPNMCIPYIRRVCSFVSYPFILYMYVYAYISKIMILIMYIHL